MSKGSPGRFMNENVCPCGEPYRLLTRLGITGIGNDFAWLFAFHAYADRWDHVMNRRRPDSEVCAIQHVGQFNLWQAVKPYRKEVGPFRPAVETHQIF